MWLQLLWVSLGFPQQCWALGKMRRAPFIFRAITPARVIDGPNNKQGPRVSWPSITLTRPWCHPGEGEAPCAKEAKVSLQIQQQKPSSTSQSPGWGLHLGILSAAKPWQGSVLGVWGLIWGLMRVNHCSKAPLFFMDNQGKIIARFA